MGGGIIVSFSFDKIMRQPPNYIEHVRVQSPGQERERIINTVNSQLLEGGPYENVRRVIFRTGLMFSKFQENLEKFVNNHISDEELLHTRTYVTVDDKWNSQINAVRRTALFLHPRYSFSLENNNSKYDDSNTLILKVILNHDSQLNRLSTFFEELGFHGVSKDVIKAILCQMDIEGGITIRQELISKFQEKYGDSLNWFVFSEGCYGIFDNGELILTHPRWKRSVSLKMPTDGRRPRKYHYVIADDGGRQSASFRVNYYGNLWSRPIN